MALNKDTLGAALHAARSAFNDKDLDELIATYGSLDGVRLAMAKADAEQIINHITVFGLVNTVGTATAQSGKMT